MNTAEIIALLIAIVIITIMICGTWLASRKSASETLKSASEISREIVLELADKYHISIDFQPNGVINWFIGTKREDISVLSNLNNNKGDQYNAKPM